MKSRKYVLGTANLGNSYGISNTESYSRSHSVEILSHAISRGIDTFDTASDYGIAEELIGLSVGLNTNSKVITKIPTRDKYSYEFVSKCLESSLDKLKQKNIYALLFHDPDIYKKNEIPEISKKLFDSGKIKHLGFSAYNLDALLRAKEKNPEWTIFQVPENILDRRLVDSTEMLDMSTSRNIFFVRSIFLQGLLLLQPPNLPIKFQKYRNQFQALHLAAESKGVTALDLCLSYVSSIPWSSGNIVAAASVKQLDEILNFNLTEFEFDSLDKLPNQVLDPRIWGELK